MTLWYIDTMNDNVRTTILIPGELHGRLKAAAGQHRRSVHAQMLAYIELGVSLDEQEFRPEDMISAVELAVLRNPDIMAAVKHAKDGDCTELRRRA